MEKVKRKSNKGKEILITCAFLVACSQSPSKIDFEESWRERSHATTQDYRIRPGDTLDIKFFYQPELNESVEVRPDGRISLQLVSETFVSGLSPEELRTELVRKYAPLVKHPEVAVIMRTFSSQKVFVDGEVAKPGVVPLKGEMTVAQALAASGGLKTSALATEVVLIRREDGRPNALVLNLEDVFSGTAPHNDLVLAPLDIIVVPKDSIASVNVWVERYLRRNLPVPFAFAVTP